MLILQATRCAANIGRHGRIRYCNLFTKRRFKSSSRELGCSIGARFEAFLTTFPDSGRSCCVFGLYANPRPAKNSRVPHGGYWGHEFPGSKGLQNLQAVLKPGLRFCPHPRYHQQLADRRCIGLVSNSNHARTPYHIPHSTFYIFHIQYSICHNPYSIPNLPFSVLHTP